MKLFPALLIALVVVSQALIAQGTILQPARELAQALQDRYNSIKDFSADFTQTYEGGVLRKKITERGTVLIKKPGQMRWTYTTPLEKIFVSDGRMTYFYVPDDQQVRINPLPTDGRTSSAVLFFVGEGNLIRDFQVSYADTITNQNHHTLRLVPYEQQADYEWLIIEIDRKNLQINGLIAGDKQGGTSRFSLENIKENIGLTKETFTFNIPDKVNVIGNEHLNH